jgi:hypothetical protein
MPKKKIRKNPLYLIVLALLALVAVGLILEKTNVINLYSGGKKIEDTTAQSKVNVIDYSPATTTDNEDINAKKATGEIEQTPSTPTNDTAIQITFIANAQDFNGGQLEVRTLLNGVTDGTCALTLTKGSTVIDKQSNVIQQNTSFQCEAFIVPYSELTNGDWQIKLKVTSGDGRTNEASTSTTIN